MHGTGDHPVGQPERDHEGTGVGDVDDDVVRRLGGDAAVRPAPRVLGGEPAPQRLLRGVGDGQALEVDAGPGGGCGHLPGIAEQEDVRDAAPDRRGGRGEHPRLGSLGQDDPAALRPGPLDEVVLEHERGHRVAADEVEPVEHRRPVHVRGEQLERGGGLARGAVGQRAAGARRDRRGLEGVERRHRDGQPGAEAVDEPLDERLGPLPAGQQDAGEPRERLRAVRHEHTDEDVAAVAGDDDEAVLAEVLQHPGEGHRRDDERDRLDVQPLGGAEEELAADGVQEPAHGGGGEQRQLRDDVRADVRSGDVRREGFRCRPGVGAVRRRGGEGGAGGGHVARGDPVRDDGEDPAGVRLEGVPGDVRRGDHLGRGPPAPVDDEEHRHAEVHRETAVVRELGRRADVGVVRADDEDGVVLALERPEPLDDRRGGGVRVGVHVVVGDPARGGRRGVVRHDRREPPADELHDRVRRVCADDGPEEADPPDPPRHRLDEAEGDGRLAALGAGRGHVHGSGHPRQATQRRSPPPAPPAAG